MKEGFENVILGHRVCWYRPSNLQTNKIERLEEVKLAVHVWPPYTQSSNNFVELSHLPSVIPNANEFQDVELVYLQSHKAFDSN